MDSNSLTGGIPSELGMITGLEILALTRNQLSGEIPSELGHLTDLVELSVVSNRLWGEIPLEVCDLWDYNLEWLGNGQTDFSCNSRTYGGASCPVADPACCRLCEYA